MPGAEVRVKVMSEYSRFIARIITRLNPEAWDAIIPHGPPWVTGLVPDPWRQFLVGPGPQPWHTGPKPDPWFIGRDVLGPSPQPWRTPVSQRWDRFSAVALNPQPLPPKERFAVAVTDAMLSQVVHLANAAELAGGDSGGNLLRRAVTMLQDWDELCPRWPKWPKNWPPPPDPPDWLGDEMSPVAHFLAATRVLAAADAVYDESIASTMSELGDRQFDYSLSRMG